jgi:acyl carrier protein
MTSEDFNDVVKSKVHGVENLQRMFSDMKCYPDFFIALSSMAGIIGNRGQAAYAAANTYLDAFSQSQRGRELGFTAIDLAPLWDVGYLANDPENRKQVEATFGKTYITEAELHSLLAFGVVAARDETANRHVITGMEVTVDQQNAFWLSDSKFSKIVEEFKAQLAANPDLGNAATVKVSAAEIIQRASCVEDAVGAVIAGLVEKIASVAMCPANEVNTAKPLAAYGLDSLSAIEVRRWIFREFQTSLQILEVLSAASLNDLTNVILEKSKLVSTETKVEWGLGPALAVAT